MNSKQIFPRYSQSLMFIATLSWMQAPAIAMQTLNDQQLSQATGQSAFFTNYIGTGDLGNPNNGVTPGSSSNIGFYTLGLNGKISLNANINRLQLGCGGVSGPGCDIDLSQVRLTGSKAGPSGTFADSDATLQNPFLQLAIQDPTQLSKRHVVGIAFGAQNADALLSVGLNMPTITSTYQTSCNQTGFLGTTDCTPAVPTTSNSVITNKVTYEPGKPGGAPTTITAVSPTTDCGNAFATVCTRTSVVVNKGEQTGINSLSGNFQTVVSNLLVPTHITGTTFGAADGDGDLFLSVQNDPTKDNYQPDNVTCDASGAHCGFGATDPTSGKKSGTYFQYVSGKRLTGLSLGAMKLDLTNIGGLAGLIGKAYAQIKPQNLIDVHNLSASSTNNQGLLLSLNSMQITWPQVGSSGIYSFPSTSQFLNSSSVADTNSPITSQSLAAKQGWWLSVPTATIAGTSANMLKTADVVLNGNSQVLSSLASPGVPVPSLNLQQVPVPNCYNGMKFC